MKTKPSSEPERKMSNGGEAEAPSFGSKVPERLRERGKKDILTIKTKSDKYLLCTTMHLVLLQGLRHSSS